MSNKGRGKPKNGWSKGEEMDLALAERARMLREADELRERAIVKRIREGVPAVIIAEMFGAEPKRILDKARKMGVELTRPSDWYGMDPA